MLFRERLTVPVTWWLLALLFAVSLTAAIGFYLGPVWGICVGVAALVVATAAFSSMAVLVTVDETELRVGRSVVERSYLGRCWSLDAASTDRRSGVEADARAHLVLRPYIATAVEIGLDDPDDPVPYWLVSSRRPDELATALGGVPVTEPTR